MSTDNQLDITIDPEAWKKKRAELYGHVREAEQLVKAIPRDTDDELRIMVRGLWAKMELIEARIAGNELGVKNS